MSRQLSEDERPRVGDDLYKHPLHPQMHAMDPDGLPRPIPGTTIEGSLAPSLTLETLVCMGDESEYVVRDQWDHIVVSFAPDKVRRLREGMEVVLLKDLSDDDRGLLIRANLVVESENLDPGALFDAEYGLKLKWIRVEALRPQCGFYRRVMTDFNGHIDGTNLQAKQIERVCTAQKSEAGEYLSLNGTRVYACEHRSPRDFVSEERLRDFDKKRLAEAAKSEETWDLEAAEAAWATEKEKAGES